MAKKRKAPRVTQDPRWVLEFELACREWVQKLGCTEWRVVFSTRESPGGAFASTFLDCSACTAHFVWNLSSTDLGDFPSPSEIAKHEVLHVLLHRLVCTAADTRKIDGVLVDSEEHSVIRRLLGVL
jgi:hypothetical protein